MNTQKGLYFHIEEHTILICNICVWNFVFLVNIIFKEVNKYQKLNTLMLYPETYNLSSSYAKYSSFKKSGRKLSPTHKRKNIRIYICQLFSAVIDERSRLSSGLYKVANNSQK